MEAETTTRGAPIYAPDTAAAGTDSYRLADPADLVTLTVIKLPEHDIALRFESAILQQALKDIRTWPASPSIFAAWPRLIRVEAIVDLHRNLITGIERDWAQDLREERILRRTRHTFDAESDKWTAILTDPTFEVRITNAPADRR